MTLSNSLRSRILSAIILILFVIMIAYIYLKANIVQESKSKYGISGYTITKIDYILLASDPSKVKSIILDVAPADSSCETADARITIDNGATWINCDFPAADKWTYSFPDLKEPGISSLSNIRLITNTPMSCCKKFVFSIFELFI